MSKYPFVWKVGNELIQIAKSKVHLRIAIMSDMTNSGDAIKACDKGRKSVHGLFGIFNVQMDFNPITNIINLYRQNCSIISIECIWNPNLYLSGQFIYFID